MNYWVKSAACCAVLHVVVGCSQDSTPQLAPSPQVPQAQAQSPDDPLPESSPEDAIAKHGATRLIELATGGNPKAQYFAAFAFFDGAPGVTRNESEGYKWLLRSANQGSSSAQFFLSNYWFGRAGSEGHLFKVNGHLLRGFSWLMVAESGGHPNAKAELNRKLSLYLDHKPGQPDIAAAMRKDVILPAQTAASAWRPCKEFACWDIDFRDPPCSSQFECSAQGS